MDKPLKNTRHELFVQGIVKGMTQKDAALAAGYSANGVDVQASNLLRNTKVIERKEHLQSLTVSDTVLTVKQRKELLSEQARMETKQPATGKERVMAIAELNKMDGSYAPEKHAILGDILIEVKYV